MTPGDVSTDSTCVREPRSARFLFNYFDRNRNKKKTTFHFTIIKIDSIRLSAKYFSSRLLELFAQSRRRREINTLLCFLL